MFTVRLTESDRAAMLVHLLALGNEDRRLRFGFPARDSSIERYINDIDFERDTVFGVDGDGRAFDGIVHLALASSYAEIGISVLEHARGRGVGSALVSRAAMHARNRGIEVLFMHCLSENRAIMRIARTLGMQVVMQGTESEASMPLPAPNPLTRLRERVVDRMALCDAALREVLLPPTSGPARLKRNRAFA